MRFLTLAFYALGASLVAACTPPGNPPSERAAAGAPAAPNLGALTGTAKVTTPSGIVFESMRPAAAPRPRPPTR